MRGIYEMSKPKREDRRETGRAAEIASGSVVKILMGPECPIDQKIRRSSSHTAMTGSLHRIIFLQHSTCFSGFRG